MTEFVDILMLTTGRWQQARTAISELRSRTVADYRLIVIGCSSARGMPEVLAEMVQDGLIDWLALMSPGYGSEDGWRVGMALVETPLFVQVTDEWLPPAGEPHWLDLLLGIAAKRPEYKTLALRPSFFTMGVPPLVRDGNLLTVPWTELSFRCVRRGVSALPDKAGYVPHLRAEYLPGSVAFIR